MLAKYLMILVNDYYDLVPELFDTFPEFTKSTTAEIDILPAVCKQSFKYSNNFTVLVQPEPIDSLLPAHETQITCKPNAVWALSGHFLRNSEQIKNWILYLASLTMTVRVNPNLPAVEPGAKSYVATALLGGWSQKRGLVLNELRKHGLLDQCLVNYYDRTAMKDDNQRQQLKLEWPDYFYNYRTPALDQLDNEVFLNIAFDHSVNRFNSCRPIPNSKAGQHGWISQLVPYNIYNNAYISLVTETEGGKKATDENNFFVSEKITKPILVGHPFLVYGGQYYLKNLRELGFETFDPWLDESYDLIKDPILRICAMVKSLNNFAQLTESEKLSKMVGMQPAVDHNRRWVQDRRWGVAPIANAIKQNLNLKKS